MLSVVLFFISLQVFSTEFARRVVGDDARTLDIYRVSGPDDVSYVSPYTYTGVLEGAVGCTPGPTTRPRVGVREGHEVCSFTVGR